MTGLFKEVYGLVIIFIFFIFSISVHECAHAYTAYRLGDPTAKNQGRITLNPLKHLDPLGTLMIFLIRFGWAKPTPVNAMYFKDRKKGVMLCSLAGPMSNLVLAIILAFPLLYFKAQPYSPLKSYILTAFIIGFDLNVVLAIFNLIPLPPLDGFKILSGFMPSRWYYKMLEYEVYITMAFAILMFTGVLGRILRPIVNIVESAIIYIASPIIGLIT